MSATCVVYVLWRPRWTARLREALTGLRIRAALNIEPAGGLINSWCKRRRVRRFPMMLAGWRLATVCGSKGR